MGGFTLTPEVVSLLIDSPITCMQSTKTTLEGITYTDVCSPQSGRILASDRAHFDQASAILEAWGGTRCPREWDERGVLFLNSIASSLRCWRY